METALILSIISSIVSLIGVIFAILSFFLSLKVKKQTATFATKSDYEKIINFCKDLHTSNDISIRLKKNTGKINELQLLGVLFGEKYAERFYNFKNYTNGEFKTYIEELEKIYHEKMKEANSAF